MGNSTSLNQEQNDFLLKNKDNDENLKKYLRPEIKLIDIKNISKAFKLLDKNKEGYIYYDVGKITESKYNDLIIYSIDKQF